MAANHAKITVYFDRMTEVYGSNGAAKLHRALLKDPITPQVRSQLRKFIAKSRPKPTVN